MMSEPPHGRPIVLGYALRRSRLRRVGPRIGIAIACLVGLIGVGLVYRTAVPKWNAYQITRHRVAMWEAAMNDPLPGGLIAYDEDDVRAMPLLADAAHYHRRPGTFAAL